MVRCLTREAHVATTRIQDPEAFDGICQLDKFSYRIVVPPGVAGDYERFLCGHKGVCNRL